MPTDVVYGYQFNKHAIQLGLHKRVQLCFKTVAGDYILNKLWWFLPAL